jgi:hypothetical protein
VGGQRQLDRLDEQQVLGASELYVYEVAGLISECVLDLLTLLSSKGVQTHNVEAGLPSLEDDPLSVLLGYQRCVEQTGLRLLHLVNDISRNEWIE